MLFFIYVNLTSKTIVTQIPPQFSLPKQQKPQHLDSIPPLLRTRASNVFEEYKALHAKILDETDTTVEKKFYILRPMAWGLGNFQLRTIMSLMLAILTNRALIIDDPFYYKYYHWPINFAVPLSEVIKKYGNSSYFEIDIKSWDTCADYNDNMGNSKYVFAPQKWFGGVPYFVYANPKYERFLTENFGRYFYYFIGNYLLSKVAHPPVVDILAKEKERLYGSYGDNLYKIGLQIRWGRGTNDFYLSDNVTDVIKFWHCAASLVDDVRLQGYEVVIFLATDTLNIRERTVRYFSHNVTPPVQVVHIEDKSIRREGDKDIAMVDQMLLSDVDDLIVTHLSTFGHYAHAISGIQPLTAHRLWRNCFRRVNSQTGLLTPGGGWPYGDMICQQFPCCAERIDKLKALWLW